MLKTLTASPLRELTGEQIGPYAGYAITTVGDVEDYKHFLPRILELSVRQPAWAGTEPPIIGQRLKMGNWGTWPPSEQAAIRALFANAWMQAIQEHTDNVDAANCLVGIAVLDLNLMSMLEKWLTEPSSNAALQLASFILTQAELFFEDELRKQSYWCYANEANIHLMKGWLLSAPVPRLLVAAHAQIAPFDRWLIDKALKKLASLGGSRVH